MKNLSAFAHLTFTLALFLTNLLALQSFGQFGTIDPTFVNTSAPNGFVESMALQPDGKVIISGEFTKCGTVNRTRIARLNADGTLDTSFDPLGGLSSQAYFILLQPDGKILVVGNFGLVQGTSMVKIARLHPNGLLDTSFHSGAPNTNYVLCMALQSDGKILLGGSFTSYNGVAHTGITRVLANGRRDTSFHPGAGAPGSVETITLDPDGKILIAGLFTSYNNTDRNKVARLLPNGTLDTSFDPGTGASQYIVSSKRQPDGRYILAGEFATFNGMNRKRVVRLLSDGSVDPSFDPGTGASNAVITSDLLSDGKILVGGQFTTFNGTAQKYITCLNADGSLASSFNVGGLGASAQISEILVQPDGNILVGGLFTSFNGASRNRLVRIKGQTTTVVATQLESDGIAMFPNPAETQAMLQNSRPVPVTLVVRDMMGRQIEEGTIPSEGTKILDLRSWSKGMYTIETIDSGKRNVQRLVVN